MRIPISDTDVGVFHSYNNDTASFTPYYYEWSYEYGVRHNYRQGTWAEFKEVYPYASIYGRTLYRSKKKTKYFR